MWKNNKKRIIFLNEIQREKVLQNDKFRIQQVATL